MEVGVRGPNCESFAYDLIVKKNVKARPSLKICLCVFSSILSIKPFVVSLFPICTVPLMSASQQPKIEREMYSYTLENKGDIIFMHTCICKVYAN